MCSNPSLRYVYGLFRAQLYRHQVLSIMLLRAAKDIPRPLAEVNRLAWKTSVSCMDLDKREMNHSWQLL